MNVLKKYLYFDFDIIERQLSNVEDYYIKVTHCDNKSSIKDRSEKGIEVVFISSDFFVIGFVFFSKVTDDIYEMSRMVFDNKVLQDYADKFIGISLSKDDLETLKEKKGFFEL